MKPPLKRGLGSGAWLLALVLAAPLHVLAQDAADAAVRDASTHHSPPHDASTHDASTHDAAPGDASHAGAAAEAQSDAGADGGAQGASPEPPELPPEHQPRLTAELTPTDHIVTGDALTLEIRADVPVADDVAVPEQSFAPFEILEKHRRVEDNTAGRHTFVFRLRLIALAPGDSELHPVQLRVVTGDGVIGHVETRSFHVHVGSALGNEPHAEPKPPTEPVSVMVEDYTLAWLAGGLLVLVLVVLLTLLAARWWRKRERAAAPPPPPRPPWELAIARLESLRSGRLAALENEQGEEWIDGLSDAMRDYLGQRYGFEGLESTTDELIHHLREVNPAGLTVQELAALLGECDLVKFARASVNADDMDRLLSEAFRMVRASMPRPLGQTSTAAAPDSYRPAAAQAEAVAQAEPAAQTEPAAQAEPAVQAEPDADESPTREPES